MMTFAIKVLMNERRALLDDMALRGPGKNLFDSRPFLVSELDESVKILKKANGKRK
jgi:hypothetical protein